jgi:hypothetical protein
VRRDEQTEAFERSDVNPTGVMVFFVALLALVGVALVVLWWLYGAFAADLRLAEPSPAPRATQLPPEPRIQQAPAMDLIERREREDAILNTYGWVNRETGAARIPIDRAMQLLAERGLPARSDAGPGPTVADTGPESGGPQTGSPVPRFNRPPGLEPSRPLRGIPHRR